MDIRNLGNFESIQAVWEAYPHGGIEGDYLYIPNEQGTKYRWNKYIQKWENAEVVTETPTREARTVSDLEVQNDLHVGGDAEIEGDLKVNGKMAVDPYYPNKGKKQSEINAEVAAALDDTYTKEELNNMITTPDQEYITLKAESGDTLADIFDGVTGAADTIYRVGNWDGTQYDTTCYSEYAWNGSDFVFLDVKNVGIDDEPTAGSENLVKSGGISAVVKQTGFVAMKYDEAPSPARYCWYNIPYIFKKGCYYTIKLSHVNIPVSFKVCLFKANGASQSDEVTELFTISNGEEKDFNFLCRWDGATYLTWISLGEVQGEAAMFIEVNGGYMSSDIQKLQMDVSDIADAEKINTLKVGDVPNSRFSLSRMEATTGVAIGDTGEVVSVSSQTWNAHVKYAVSENDFIFIHAILITGVDYNQLVFADSENKIVKLIFGEYPEGWSDFVVKVPAGATSLYINLGTSNVADITASYAERVEYIPLQEQVNALSVQGNNLALQGCFNLIDNNKIIDRGFGYPVFTDGVLSGYGSQGYTRHVTFAADDPFNYAVLCYPENSYLYCLDKDYIVLVRERRIQPSDTVNPYRLSDIPANTKYIIVNSSVSNTEVHEAPKVFEASYGNFGIPKFFDVDNYLDNKIQDIRDNSNIKNGCVFAFLTDLHYYANFGLSGRLLQKIKNETTMQFVLCGGDVIYAYGTENFLKNSTLMFEKERSNVGKDIWFTTKGNHDFTILDNSNNLQRVNEDEGFQYNELVRTLSMSKAKLVNGKCYYSVEIEGQNIKVLVLDQYELLTDEYGPSNYVSVEQKQWLAAELTNCSNTGIILLSHTSLSPNISSYNPVLEPVASMLIAMMDKTVYHDSDIDVDFSDSTNHVICALSGHSHKDESDIYQGIVCITTTSDATLNDDPNTRRTFGTISECAFDVIAVDEDNKTIKLTRIGGGNDRDFNYV